MTTTAAPIKFPAELQIFRPEIVSDLNAFPDPHDWPEGESVIKAQGPAVYCDYITKLFHHALRKRKIVCLFVESMNGTGNQIKLGNATKAAPKVRLLTGYDFILTFNHTAWMHLTFEQRAALVDHELQHCDVDSDSGKCILVPHDIEEFGSIIGRYGLWTPDRKRFAEICNVALQGDLFSAAMADAPDEPWDQGPPKVAPTDIPRPMSKNSKPLPRAD